MSPSRCLLAVWTGLAVLLAIGAPSEAESESRAPFAAEGKDEFTWTFELPGQGGGEPAFVSVPVPPHYWIAASSRECGGVLLRPRGGVATMFRTEREDGALHGEFAVARLAAEAASDEGGKPAPLTGRKLAALTLTPEDLSPSGNYRVIVDSLVEDRPVRVKAHADAETVIARHETDVGRGPGGATEAGRVAGVRLGADLVIFSQIQVTDMKQMRRVVEGFERRTAGPLPGPTEWRFHVKDRRARNIRHPGIFVKFPALSGFAQLRTLPDDRCCSGVRNPDSAVRILLRRFDRPIGPWRDKAAGEWGSSCATGDVREAAQPSAKATPQSPLVRVEHVVQGQAHAATAFYEQVHAVLAVTWLSADSARYAADAKERDLFLRGVRMWPSSD